MRQRGLIRSGVVLGWLLITAAGRADEATAVATLKQNGGLFGMRKYDASKPVTHLTLTGVGYRRKLRTADLKALKEFKHLEYLALGFTDITDAGLYELREIETLRTIILVNTGITDAGLRYLKEVKGLRELNLSLTRITDAGLRELKDLKELRSLFIEKTRVTDAGMKELKGLSNLEGLILDDTQVTDTGVYELIELPKLESLLLNRTRVTDAGLKLIPYFKNLKQVQVWETRGVTKAGVKKLREALPRLTVGHASVIGS